MCPQEVSLTQATTLTETIASSGRVRGVTATVVGAQAADRILLIEDGRIRDLRKVVPPL
jgi:hypothetical protein